MFVLLAGCQNMKPAETDNTKTFYIDSSLADCMGVAPMKCMKVKENPSDDWQLFIAQFKASNINQASLILYK